MAWSPGNWARVPEQDLAIHKAWPWLPIPHLVIFEVLRQSFVWVVCFSALSFLRGLSLDVKWSSFLSVSFLGSDLACGYTYRMNLDLGSNINAATQVWHDNWILSKS